MSKHLLRRAVAVVCAATLALCALAGCSKDASSQEHEPLTVCNVNNLFPDEFIEIFQQSHPEVLFDASAYRGSNGSGYAMETLEHGDIPDVYVSTYLLNPEAQRENLIDLSSYDFINNYTTTMLNDADNEGGIYLLPSCFQMVGISYNKTLMEEHGWPVPNNFEELKALAPKIEAAGLVPMRGLFNLDGYPFNYFFNVINTDYFHTAAGSQWKEDFSTGQAKAAGNQELLAGVEYFQEWIDAGLIKASDIGSFNEPQEAFMNGECVFFLSLGLSKYENTTEDGRTYEFGVIPWLSADGTTNTLTVATSRYFGLSRELLEPGNEQKLEDALALMEFVSTVEGQKALAATAASPQLYAPSLTGADVPEDSPFHGLSHLVDEGHTIQLVYVGWEDLIVPMAQDIKALIRGEVTPEQLLTMFDATYERSVNGDGNALAYAETDMSWDDALKICCIATGMATDADVALASLGGYNEAHEINDRGVNWYFYEGPVTVEVVNVFRTKCSTLSVLEMTGAEIKALAEGGFDLYGTGNPFPYTLVVKGGGELEDDKVYRLAAGTKDLTEDVSANAVETFEISTQQAVIDYVSTLGTFGPEDIVWN